MVEQLFGHARRVGTQRVRRSVLRLAVFLMLAASCEPFTGPSIRRVSLVSLEFADAPIAMRDSGALVVVGRPANPAFELGVSGRVSVLVASSAGDREQLYLWHEGGGRGTVREGDFSTVAFLLVGEPSTGAEALERRLQSVGLVPVRISPFSLLYQVITFDPTRIARIATDVSRWPEVSIVELVQGPVYGPNDGGNTLSGPLRVSYSAPKPHDRVLQVAAGDTLRAIHVGPAGDTVRALMLAPEWPGQ